MEVIEYVMAIYGAWALISSIVSSMRQIVRRSNPGIKLVLMVKNQEDTIEGIIRYILNADIPAKAMSGHKLTVLDMSSGDDTFKILSTLKKDCPNLEILSLKEKDAIFSGFDESNSGLRTQPKAENS